MSKDTTPTQANDITLRDYFAAQVIGSYCTHPKGWYVQMDEAARTAYRMADALLKAREVKP